jgi:putative two-component system response regulator
MIENQPAPTRILIVDDEPEMRSIIARSLADSSRECIPASNPFEAMEKIRKDRFSLVMSDVHMPEMSGIELLRRIKDHDPDISVIMITGVRDLATAVDSLKLGACDYITKPFEVLAIRRAVDRALERNRLIVENRYYQRELERLVEKRTLELHGALEEIEESYRYTLEALAAALDAREHETQAHSQTGPPRRRADSHRARSTAARCREDRRAGFHPAKARETHAGGMGPDEAAPPDRL